MPSQSTCTLCRTTFPSEQVRERVDGARTPLCPHCEVDAVVKGALAPEPVLDSEEGSGRRLGISGRSRSAWTGSRPR